MEFYRIQMEGFSASRKGDLHPLCIMKEGCKASAWDCVASAQLFISSPLCGAHTCKRYIFPSSHGGRLIWKSMGVEFARTAIKEKNSYGKSLGTDQLMNQRGIRRERETKRKNLFSSLHFLCQCSLGFILSKLVFLHPPEHSFSELTLLRKILGRRQSLKLMQNRTVFKYFKRYFNKKEHISKHEVKQFTA